MSNDDLAFIEKSWDEFIDSESRSRLGITGKAANKLHEDKSLSNSPEEYFIASLIVAKQGAMKPV